MLSWELTIKTKHLKYKHNCQHKNTKTRCLEHAKPTIKPEKSYYQVRHTPT